MELVSKKIEQAVTANFDYNEKIVVGVSGGADSMTLLECLRKSEKKLNIIVAHLNHKLRGLEGDNDASFVRDWCLKNSLNFVCKTVNISNIAKKNKVSIELAGRNERYKFFNEFKCKIVTAHTLSDRIETLIFNIARGCALKGLCSIPKFRGKIVRPLLSFTRSEIEQYCKENNIPFKIDSSNLSLKYVRNKIRLKIVPRFYELNSKFEANILRMFHCLESDETYFSEKVLQILQDNLIDNMLKFSDINLMHISIKTRVIAEFLRINNIQPNFDLIYKILSYGCNDFRFNIPGKKIICLEKKVLKVKNIPKNYKFDLVLPDFIEYCHKNLLFIRTKIEHFNYFLDKTAHIFLFKIDYDKIKGLIHVRSRIDGDRIMLINRPTKKLKCLMQEAKIPADLRDEVVVFADDEGPFCVEGFGVAKRVAVDDDTKNLMLIFKKKIIFLSLMPYSLLYVRSY